MINTQILSTEILGNFLGDEKTQLNSLLPLIQLKDEQYHTAELISREFIEAIRHPEDAQSHWLPYINFDDFLSEYGLDSTEGVSLMCLAEALLRIPDHQTAQALIEDKLGDKDWQTHIGHSDSFWINASSWGLLLTGKYFSDHPLDAPRKIIQRISHKLGDPIAEQAIRQAMIMIGEQFVAGESIHAGLAHGNKEKERGYIHSYDMLGEAALCQADVERYIHAYSDAIKEVAQDIDASDNFLENIQRDSISIKLSALHPRYEFHHRDQIFKELLPHLKQLVTLAKDHCVPITIDAEESERLELNLELFAALINDKEFAHWPYIGLAVQAYQKRAIHVIHWLAELSQSSNKRIPVRLVKGAYWDSEIKTSQQRGLKGYPVWSVKNHTDISYLACAHQLFQTGDLLYPQFATHNAQTVSTILLYGMQYPLVRYEFQRLHGMGEPLYQHLLHHSQRIKQKAGVRIYAPIGKQSELLAYLVRRLLENGANSSFVNAVNDENVDISQLCLHPAKLYEQASKNVAIPLPEALYANRKNSQGVNLQGQQDFKLLQQAMAPYFNKPLAQHWLAKPSSFSEEIETNKLQNIINPANNTQVIGHCLEADNSLCKTALDITHAAFPLWQKTETSQRANMLEQTAELMQSNQAELMALALLEAGKTFDNALDELREAIDFCRYYALQCRQQFGEALILEGPMGEDNRLHWRGRGVFLCISPWNFPLAIFVGQIAAALAAGNTVIAKPASTTPLIASLALDLFHQAGIPKEVLQFLPAKASTFSESVLNDPRITGLAFTGSTSVAREISLRLMERNAALPTIIAETGGQNAMIVDSSALPEQVVKDALRSAFDSGGQRCSALRVMFVQADIFAPIKNLLLGAMAELKVGNPQNPANDIGPVIDARAQHQLLQHFDTMRESGKVLGQTPLPESVNNAGYYVPPTLVQLEHISELQQEHFGPILHLISYQSNQLDDVISSINATGFGLTFGIHSRINARIEKITKAICAGNVYINRDMVGAVVGCQPFGGLGLSGTGPKAGGPHYLPRFAAEVTCSNNIAAVGGNASLLNLQKI
ncbi:MAG: bifunctional proline dehydrogenase/L-glutamate gamma-semialdehyde dehydrogenase PutA [Pseudomonadales bacterium]|nr:bifunctional proline dehydrogenase/L-glutamate gamma-semialdehyde dehydrogenase PutA [Pseudomonadales bacterium]